MVGWKLGKVVHEKNTSSTLYQIGVGLGIFVIFFLIACSLGVLVSCNLFIPLFSNNPPSAFFLPVCRWSPAFGPELWSNGTLFAGSIILEPLVWIERIVGFQPQAEKGVMGGFGRAFAFALILVAGFVPFLFLSIIVFLNR